jgi:pyridoxal phosphate enzyme (YggS family)
VAVTPGGAPPGSKTITAGLARATERIVRACQAAGREADSVRLLLATKRQPASAIRAALEAGAGLIGENRVQELAGKGPELASLPHEAHLIGPLQSNKINAALEWAACIETIASLKLAGLLAARANRRAKPVGVMVQVNVSGEPTKSGVHPDQATDLAYQIAQFHSMRLEGFMTVGLNSEDPVAVARCYASLREIRDQVAASGATGTRAATELSMGMSRDLEIAIAEGATIVRLGTAVFGPRDPTP